MADTRGAVPHMSEESDDTSSADEREPLQSVSKNTFAIETPNYSNHIGYAENMAPMEENNYRSPDYQNYDIDIQQQQQQQQQQMARDGSSLNHKHRPNRSQGLAHFTSRSGSGYSGGRPCSNRLPPSHRLHAGSKSPSASSQSEMSYPEILEPYSKLSDHGTPPPAPAPSVPDYPPRGSSFHHPGLLALNQQHRAAALLVKKENDEPPTYEVIPYSTGKTTSASSGAWNFLPTDRNLQPGISSIARGIPQNGPPTVSNTIPHGMSANHVLTPVPGDPSGRLVMTLLPQGQGHDPMASHSSNSSHSARYTSTDLGHNSRQTLASLRPSWLRGDVRGRPGSGGCGKSCATPQCSWRLLAIGLLLMCGLLAAALAYITVSTVGPVTPMEEKCVFVDDSDIASSEESAIIKDPALGRTPPIVNVDVNRLSSGQDHSGISSSSGAEEEPEPSRPSSGSASAAMELETDGRPYQLSIDPATLWIGYAKINGNSALKMTLQIPRGAPFALYGRRNVAPSITQHDFSEFLQDSHAHSLKIFPQTRSKRTLDDTPVIYNVTLVKPVEPGHWFLAVYNDDVVQHHVLFGLSLTDEMTTPCPEDCNGRGQCLSGKCSCKEGFSGPDCSISVCPVLCSGRGTYGGGRCHCEAGWTGLECDVPYTERESWSENCAVPCGANGKCIAGKCVCQPNFTGISCETALTSCTADCGSHGRCVNNTCVCHSGWTGKSCHVTSTSCDARCSQHGQCVNGTCLCSRGFYGPHCTLAGCPGDCGSKQGRGACVQNNDASFSCRCAPDWTGPDCSVMLELDCNDDKDNDGDGLTDCADSECCSVPACTGHLMCLASADPAEVAARKSPVASGASFYQRVKFLVEENAVQSYAHKDEYIDRRVSVLRGRVVSQQGLGIVGVRVSVERHQRLGFTLTRQGGWFDILVNGGGAVSLQFQRNPFRPEMRTVLVPWNRIVVLEKVVLKLGDDAGPLVASLRSYNFVESLEKTEVAAGCNWEELELLTPKVIESSSDFAGGEIRSTAIVLESQVLQEFVSIPGLPDVQMVYQSSSNPSYLSVLRLKLTPDKTPSSLAFVHLRVTVEGNLLEKTMEADQDLRFTFTWDRFNVYRQKVYGSAEVVVHVGYEPYNCSQSILWKSVVTSLAGFPPEVSGIADFNIDVNYHYMVPQNILYGGNGQVVHFRNQDRTLMPVMGPGSPRSLHCTECQGSVPALTAKILNPVAVATAGDGSLYVGDFNLIRKVSAEGRVFTVLQLPVSQVSHSYYLGVSPVDGSVFVSDCDRKQILRIVQLAEDQLANANLETNFEVVAGSGAPCLPADAQQCGDGGPAIEAKLAYPKGIAIGPDRTLYIADGTSIRAVDPQGIIKSIIGNPVRPTTGLNPAPCETALHVSQVQPQWPTHLSLNPMDNSLHWIDNNVVVRLSTSQFVETLLGHPQHCRSRSDPVTRLGILASLAFGPDGSLYLAEKPTVKSARLLRLDTERQLAEIPVTNSSDSKTAEFESISAIAVTADDTLLLADGKELRILAAEFSRPEQDPSTGEFVLVREETKEILIFNRHGQHITTKDLGTGGIKLSFSYTKASSNGKLMAIIDSKGNKVDFIRDSQERLTALETNGLIRTQVILNRAGNLIQMNQTASLYTLFGYDPATSLMVSRSEANGLSSLYTYDTSGRLTSVTLPDGESLIFNVDDEKKTIRSGETVAVISVANADDSVAVQQGRGLLRYQSVQNGSSLVYSGGAVTYRVDIKDSRIKEVFSNQVYREAHWRDVLLERVWSYARLGGRLEEKSLEVNGVRVLSVEIDGQSGSRTLYDGERQLVVTLTCDSQGHLKDIRPPSGFYNMRNTYDNNGKLQSRTWGQRQETYAYDTRGLLTEIRARDGTSRPLSITYGALDLPSVITLPSGRSFSYAYDESGGLQSIVLPSGETRHSFAMEPSLGYYRLVYTPPGGLSSNHSYIQHYDSWNRLIFSMLPGESGRTLFIYDDQSRLVKEMSGDRRVEYAYNDDGFSVAVTERDFELRTERVARHGRVFEEKCDFASKTGLAGFKFTYDYDNESRLTSIKGRIGGQILSELNLSYQSKTGALEQFGPFKVSRLRLNETSCFDGTAVLSYVLTPHLDVAQSSITILNTEVYRMEVTYDHRGRINQTRTYTRYVGLKSYVNVKNLSYDADGQFVAVDAPESWRFSYDSHGNLAKLTYRGNSIAMRHDSFDRLIKFGEGVYQYDDAGHVIQNAREERFFWSSSGLLTRVLKKGIFDVRYFYDHQKRLVARRDHHGNVTQFFYANPQKTSQVTHIFSPRDLRLITLTYDERDHLIHAQILRNRYYIATDQCGTPTVIFNQNGDMIRELVRSPFGHIVYDSNPYFYLPIDWCGGISDPATAHVHLKNNRIYDPLVGQWLNPDWSRAFRTFDPSSLHLYRLPRNDPINVNLETFLGDHQKWLTRLGYSLNFAGKENEKLGLFKTDPSAVGNMKDPIPYEAPQLFTNTLLKVNRQLGSLASFFDFSNDCSASESSLQDKFQIRLSVSRNPLGRGIFLSTTSQDRLIVKSSSHSDPAVRDVLTSIFNNTRRLNLTLPSYGQDSFYLFKQDSRRISEDMTTLRRLAPLHYANLTPHDVPESSTKELRVSVSHLNLIIVYGSDFNAESDRLWRHAVKTASRKAWLREQTILSRGGLASFPLTNSEMERLIREGHVSTYRPEAQPGIWLYPLLADDPRTIRFRKRNSSASN